VFNIKFLETIQRNRSPSKLLIFFQTDVSLAAVSTISLCWHDHVGAKKQWAALSSNPGLTLDCCYIATHLPFAHTPRRSSYAPSRL